MRGARAFFLLLVISAILICVCALLIAGEPCQTAAYTQDRSAACALEYLADLSPGEAFEMRLTPADLNACLPARTVVHLEQDALSIDACLRDVLLWDVPMRLRIAVAKTPGRPTLRCTDCTIGRLHAPPCARRLLSRRLTNQWAALSRQWGLRRWELSPGSLLLAGHRR